MLSLGVAAHKGHARGAVRHAQPPQSAYMIVTRVSNFGAVGVAVVAVVVVVAAVDRAWWKIEGRMG